MNPNPQPLSREEREYFWETRSGYAFEILKRYEAACITLEQERDAAWKEAHQHGDELGISADNLPALICGISDKLHERIAQQEEEIVRLHEKLLEKS